MNAVEVEIYRHLFQSAAEEMGIVLRKTAFSANIKERLDFSCAITDPSGEMAAQASHIPVHLGSCHLTARLILDSVPLERGDVVIVNDPYQGGTHLPDVTLFAPLFVRGKRGPTFGVLVRAHHADVGGGVPGSMGSFDEIFKEGIIIPPVKIVARGRRVRDVEELFLANVRTPGERRGDLAAQIAATGRGLARLSEMVERYGLAELEAAAEALKRRAAAGIRDVIKKIPRGVYDFADTIDGPGSARIAVRITVRRDRLIVDFAGSSPMVPSALNAIEAVTLSSVFYCVRCLADESIPTNSGCLEPVEVRIPAGTIVGARRPAAVAGGNVETSQRIVDVVFGALAQALPKIIPAASQGTMNSLSFGGVRQDGRPFTYYETIAGGNGATAQTAGASGLHSHMTNTLNTPIEALERELPVRVTAYHRRAGSGGAGARRGGDGVVREIEALVPMTATILATRRAGAPYGLEGGGSGLPGKDSVRRGRKSRTLAAGSSTSLASGERIRIETPGGGGHGKAAPASPGQRKNT
jgi:N-methylhydantoinase B